MDIPTRAKLHSAQVCQDMVTVLKEMEQRGYVTEADGAAREVKRDAAQAWAGFETALNLSDFQRKRQLIIPRTMNTVYEENPGKGLLQSALLPKQCPGLQQGNNEKKKFTSKPFHFVENFGPPNRSAAKPSTSKAITKPLERSRTKFSCPLKSQLTAQTKPCIKDRESGVEAEAAAVDWFEEVVNTVVLPPKTKRKPTISSTKGTEIAVDNKPKKEKKPAREKVAKKTTKDVV